MTAAAIAVTALRRIARDRTALFFLVALPVLVILIMGATLRGFSTVRVGLVDLGSGRAGAQLAAALSNAPDLRIRPYGSVSVAQKAVARGEVNTAVILPQGMDDQLRDGRTVQVEVLAERANGSQQAAAAAVASVIGVQGETMQAAQFATGLGHGDFYANLSLAARLQPTIVQVRATSLQVESHSDTLPEGFSYSAPTMLVMFVFLNALAGGASTIETRRLGMFERMEAAPVRPSAIIAGEALGYSVIALAQSALIVIIGSLVFGVSWGNWIAATVLVVTWALVGAGAGMLSGTLFRTPEQASAMGPALGMALAMLGGCMWPLSIVNSSMRTAGHLAPHAWAVDAWTALLSRGATLATIAPDVGILAGFAAAFLALATWRLRRALS